MAKQRLWSRIIAEIFVVSVILTACRVITTDSKCTNLIRMLSADCGIVKNNGMCCNYKKSLKTDGVTTADLNKPEDENPDCKFMSCEIEGVPERCPVKCEPTWCFGTDCSTAEARQRCQKCKCRTKKTCDNMECGKTDVPCVFPFKYNGDTYHSCINHDKVTIENYSSMKMAQKSESTLRFPKFDWDRRFGPWCATKVDENGDMVGGYDDGHWGYCMPNCPGVNGTCSTWRHRIDKPFRCEESRDIKPGDRRVSLWGRNRRTMKDHSNVIDRSLKQKCESACLSKKESGCCEIQLLRGRQENCYWYNKGIRKEMSYEEAEGYITRSGEPYEPIQETYTAAMCSPSATCKNKSECPGDTAICDNGVCVNVFDYSPLD